MLVEAPEPAAFCGTMLHQYEPIGRAGVTCELLTHVDPEHALVS